MLGLSLSLPRVDFSLYRAQAKTKTTKLKVYSSEIEKLEQKFKDLLEKLKELHSEVFSKVNWGRLVVFLTSRIS